MRAGQCFSIRYLTVLKLVPSELPVLELPVEPEVVPEELDDEEDESEEELLPVEPEVLPEELESLVEPEVESEFVEPLELVELLESEPLVAPEPEEEVSVEEPVPVESEVLPLVVLSAVLLSEPVVSDLLSPEPYCGTAGPLLPDCVLESELLVESSVFSDDVVGETRSETTVSVPCPCVTSITMPAVTATVSKPDTNVTMTATRFGSRRRLRSSLIEYVWPSDGRDTISRGLRERTESDAMERVSPDSSTLLAPLLPEGLSASESDSWVTSTSPEVRSGAVLSDSPVSLSSSSEPDMVCWNFSLDALIMF